MSAAPLKLWLLKETGGVDYDSYDGFVIAAETEEQARAIAQENGGDEVHCWVDNKRSGFAFWTDAAKATCVELVATEAGVILGSFNAG